VKLLKYLLILFLIPKADYSSAQNEIQFQDIFLQQAIKKSGTTGKLVFFMGFTSWCPHCKKMKESVFTDSTVAHYYNAHFICVMQDLEQGEGPTLSKRFNVQSYPTFVFLDSTGQRLFQVVGELDAPTMIQMGKDAQTLQKQLPYLQNQFEQNVGDTAKAIAYLQALNHGRLPTQPVVEKFFATKKEDEMINYPSWRILNMGVSDLSSPEFQFIIDHQKEYGEIVTPQRVQRKIFRTVVYNLQQPADKNDTIGYFKLRTVASGFHNTQVDSAIFNYDLQLDEVNNKWESYRITAMKSTQLYEWNDYVQLRHIADIFNKHISDVNALKTAAIWAKRSSELKSEYSNTLLYAQLLEKSGDRAGAKEAAQKAVSLAAVTNSSHAEADQLIQRVNQ